MAAGGASSSPSSTNIRQIEEARARAKPTRAGPQRNLGRTRT